LRAATGQGFTDLMDAETDPLAFTPGLGAGIDAVAADAICGAGAGTRIEVSGLQICSRRGTAISGDGAAVCVSVDQCILDARDHAPAASIGSGSITNSVIVQRGSGDGVLLTGGGSASGCTVAKPAQDLATGTGISCEGSGNSVAWSYCFGFRQAFGSGLCSVGDLASDQVNSVPVPDDFSDATWTLRGATVDPLDTVPGPFNVPLQRVGNKLNAFSRFQAPEIPNVPAGARVGFSIIVAQPTSLTSALVLDAGRHGAAELRVSWPATPPSLSMINEFSDLRIVAATLTDLGAATWRMHLVVENQTTRPVDVIPSFYVTRGIENVGLDVGMYAGNVMAGIGHLGSGFVYPDAVPGPSPLLGIDPCEAVECPDGAALDLRPIPGGPLEAFGAEIGALNRSSGRNEPLPFADLLQACRDRDGTTVSISR
ncbi:MAG: hypothetical protein AAGJ28_14270, partial [Pseudomonadota bacterium]